MRQAYSVREAAVVLDVSTEAMRELVGLVWDRPRDLLTADDLVLLRTTKGLLARRVSRARIARALERLRTRLTTEQVALQQEGNELVVGARDGRWNAETGQALLDFQQPVRAAQWLHSPAQRDANALFARAVALEREDDLRERDLAVTAYHQTLAADPMHADAHVNLGRLLHQRGRLLEALAHYHAALVARPADPTATFNLAVVLDDLGHADEAIAQYHAAIALDSTNVDACFNLARLYEQKGEKLAAIRHLKDCRRLSTIGA